MLLGPRHFLNRLTVSICRIEKQYLTNGGISARKFSIVSHTRAKRQTSYKIKLDDPSQGPLEPYVPALKNVDVTPTYPRVIQQHFNNIQRFSSCVVLTRVGNFYELYGEQAEKYAPSLNLKVAKRKTALGPVSMSGFQYFQLDRYLKLLVQDLNKAVAISEEIRNSAADQVKSGGLLYDRKVTRVITAGTLIDETFVNPYENNFLLSISPSDELVTEGHALEENNAAQSCKKTDTGVVGLSWVDLSSGDFYVQQSTLVELTSVVARIAPCEVLLDSRCRQVSGVDWQNIIGDRDRPLTFHTQDVQYDSVDKWNEFIESPDACKSPDLTQAEILAGSLLLDYIHDKLQDLKINLRPPIRKTNVETMQIDRHSLRGLEIRTTMRDGFYQGSLLHSIKKTVTKSGSRVLIQRLLAPEMSLKVINTRLDLVEEMIENRQLHVKVIDLLQKSFDLPRLVQKFSIGRGDADDLLAVGKTVDIVQQLFELVTGHHQKSKVQSVEKNRLTPLISDIQAIEFDKLEKLAQKIEKSIDEEGLSKQHMVEQDLITDITDFAEQIVNQEDSDKIKDKSSLKKEFDIEDDGDIWIMRKEASKILTGMHEELQNAFCSKIELCRDLKNISKSNSLSLKWTPQLGHYCHVKGKDCKVEFINARNISTTKTTRAFYLPEWTSLGFQIEAIKRRIRVEEQRVFSELRNEVLSNLVKLRQCTSILDELDIACSSATVAIDQRLVRPILHTGTTHNVIGGRHPMVDIGLQESGRSFTSNDCTMNNDESIQLITGPNMAGKSTYLRQNALISILAQTGCYVPAEYAEMGLVDKIFSRIGSADNLYNHQSTFMVEMVEVAEILVQATKRSFVIMDEVGRGTTPGDGVAVAYACLKYLHDRIGCRTLFATHFHKLADMTGDLKRLTTWCTDVVEDEDGSWVYAHKLKRGVNRDSHALKVAKLAGMPEEAIDIARQVMSHDKS